MFKKFKCFKFLRIWKLNVKHECESSRGSVVGWGSMQQAGRSRVRVPEVVIGFFNRPKPSTRTTAPGRLIHREKWVAGIFLVDKGRPARKAGNLIATCEPNV
jgi:hypothetical protein